MHWLKRGLHRALRHLGYEIRRRDREPEHSPAGGVAYRENPESGPINLAIKHARVADGGPFEYADVIALNKAAARFVTADHRRIVELGGGTGLFALEAAADARKMIVCSELDAATHAWAKQHRSRTNIRYINRLPESADGPFDVVVALEVIEHIADYGSFLETCVSLAPEAILSTPNKNRSRADCTAGPPAHQYHVREWTTGEFYWILRLFYRHVTLYAMPDSTRPDVIPVSVLSTLTPIIAACSGLYGRANGANCYSA